MNPSDAEPMKPAARSGINFLAVGHPEWGIDLRRATDSPLLFGFGLLTGYAAELRLAARRTRRMSSSIA
jgi:hypothetical protein